MSQDDMPRLPNVSDDDLEALVAFVGDYGLPGLFGSTFCERCESLRPCYQSRGAESLCVPCIRDDEAGRTSAKPLAAILEALASDDREGHG
jgi:hypothetical protein